MSVLELRDDGDGLVRMTGWASVTGTAYTVGHYEETIARGAFKRTLNDPNLDVQLLVNHTGLALARTTSGSLRLNEDERGLKVDADLDAEDPDVRALVPKMRRGDVTEMSFAFRAIDQDWNADYTKRLIKAVDLQRGDVSIVSFGASPTTSVSLRSQTGVVRTLEWRREHAPRDGQWERRSFRLLRDDGEDGSCDACGGSGQVQVSFSKSCPNCAGSGSADVESTSAGSRRPSSSRARRSSPRRSTEEWRAWLAAERARDEDARADHDRSVRLELDRLRRARRA